MTLIDLPEDITRRLREAAAKSGVPVSQFASELLNKELPPLEPSTLSPLRGPLADLFDQWRDEDPLAGPEDLAARNREVEEFKAAMNQNRVDSEGPSARKIFP